MSEIDGSFGDRICRWNEFYETEERKENKDEEFYKDRSEHCARERVVLFHDSSEHLCPNHHPPEV